MEPARKLREQDEGSAAPARRDLHVVEAPAHGERRTIKITGQPTRPRPGGRSATSRQIGARPDRVALWAFLLGVFLVVMAAATAHAAVL